MSKIQYSSECTGSNSSDRKDKLASASSGWEDRSSYKETIDLIKRANRKVRLLDIFKSYNINFNKGYSNQVWSNLISCPLPSHKDRTPSFGYNFKTGHFNCLGCKASGKAVEFISAKEGRTKKAVAQSILDHYGDLEDVEEEDVVDPRIEELMFEASRIIRRSYHSDDEDESLLADKVAYWFDNYISLKAGSVIKRSPLDVEELEARVSRVRSLLGEE